MSEVMDARSIDRVFDRFETIPSVPGFSDVEIRGVLRVLVRPPCPGGQAVFVEPEPSTLVHAVGDMVRLGRLGRIPCHAFKCFVGIGLGHEAPEFVVKP